jgi:uridine phosphorylase
LFKWAEKGVLAVEMQAASLFALAAARNASIAVVVMVSNAVDYKGDQFDKGTNEHGLKVIEAIVRAGEKFLRAGASKT